MNVHRFFIFFSLIAALGFGILAGRFHLDTARRALAAGESSRQATALADQASRLKCQLDAIEAERLARAVAQAPATKPDPVPPEKTAAPAQPNWLELLRTDPLVQSRFLAYQRSSVMMEYQPLLKSLALTPEQIARFEENLSQIRADRMDLRSAQIAKGLAVDDSALLAFQGKLQADYENAQKEVLGEQGFEQWKAYERTSFAREIVRDAAGAATLAGLTLTEDQVSQLTVLVATAVKSSLAENRGQSAGIDWHQLDESSRSFLTPEQVDFIQNTEVVGPLGRGTRYQNRLNELITNADWADQLAKRAALHP